MSHVSHDAEDTDERHCSHGATLPTHDTVHKIRGRGRAQPTTLEPQEVTIYDSSDRSRVGAMSHVSHDAEDTDERPCSHGAMLADA